MGSATVLLTLSIISVLTTASTAQGFNCSSGGTCHALIDYVSPNTTTLLAIQTLFGVKNLRSLLGANNYHVLTSANQTVNATSRIKIPFPCICTNGTGKSNRLPVYTVQEDDGLYHIAAEVFSGLVMYPQIQAVNNITDPNYIEDGQSLWIPLPCSCDEVDGSEVVHYGHVVKTGSSVEQIAQEYGTTPETLLRLNGLADPNDLNADSVLDVPLKVCTSNISNNSSDYPLLVSNGTYALTANDCVQCKCDSANNWILQCEPSQLKPTDWTNWSECPNMQCQGTGSFYIGNITSSTSCNRATCAYAGYNNVTISTTLVTESTCLDSQRRRRMWLIVGAPVLVSLIILTLVSKFCYLRWKRCCFGGENGSSKDGISRDTELLTYKAGTSITVIDELSGAHKLELSGKKGHELLLFNFSSIEIATDYFSDANKLGQGGFGPVYKGKLVKGQEIAVKRLSRSSGQGLEEFKNEVVLISKLQHRNLVRLIGCCIQGEERILIYEYLPNNSLDSFLFDATKRALLDWKKRVCIIEGIAQGLLYLHKYSRLKIIHRDLKNSNILLDSAMNPKISDFGLARIFGENESRANTNRIVGTYGYMSPEYAMDGLFSVKSDVFSFGVMMLEIISGKKNTGFYQWNRSLNLLGYAWDLYREERCLELMDPAVEETCSRNEVLRCVQVGLLCVQENAVDRPTMSDVVSMLSNESITLPAPKQPAFSTIVGVNDADLLENPRPCSINNVTVSEIEAR